jgi:hypothetical protein
LSTANFDFIEKIKIPAAPDRQQTPRPLPFYAAFYKGTIKW